MQGSYPSDLRIYKKKKSPNIYAAFLPEEEDDPRPNGGRTKGGKRRTSSPQAQAGTMGTPRAKRGHLSEALDRFNDVLMSNPHHVRARLNRITLHLLAEDVQTALDDCDWLLMTYPNLLLAKLRRGEALIQHGIFDEAENRMFAQNAIMVKLLSESFK